jgi:AraC family transcriptional regulator
MTASLSEVSRPQPHSSRLAASFGAENAPFLASQALPNAVFSVTEVKVDEPLGLMSDPLPAEDAYMICCPLRGQQDLGYWEEGRHVRTFDLGAGETTVHDLRRKPFARLNGPIHTVLWHLPRAGLNALAEEANAPYIDELRHQPAVGTQDETINHINAALLPALRSPGPVSRLFIDHTTLALAAHVAHTYGGLQIFAGPVKGGLAPWQERRAKEMIAANLSGETPLAAVAASCGLSPSHFARAFRKSTGLAPHAWLLQARVEHAMIMLRRRDPSLSEISLACGFVDQSHFTRVFVRRVGVTPGAWRRMVFS